MGYYPKRKKIRLSPSAYQNKHAFFITIDTYRRHPWFRDYPPLAEFGIRLLRDLREDRDSSLYAWCLMPDHIHLLLEDRNVLEFLRLFKGRMIAKARSFYPGRKLWQRSFYDHGLRKEERLVDVASYIWENPVRKSWVNEATLYPWSGSMEWKNWRAFFERG